MATKKTTKKAKAAKKGKKAASKGGDAAAKRSGGGLPPFLRAVTPAPPLAAVIGPEPRPRTVALRQLWIHIKRNGMQSPKDRSRFIPQADVLPLFDGRDEVPKTELGRYLDRYVD